MILPPIRDWIAADAIADALLRPTGSVLRVFQDEIPQDVPTPINGNPAAVYSLIFGAPNNYLSGSPSMDQVRLQVDVWAATSADASVTAAAVRNVVERYGYVIAYNFTERDRDTREYRVSFDFTCWQPRGA